MPIDHPAFALIKHYTALATIVACSMPTNAQSVITKAFGEGILKIPGLDGGQLFSTGDFNHDGYKDLLFGYDYPDNDFSVALGDAQGSFTLQGPFTPTSEYRGIAAGDITGDGSISFVLRTKNNDEVILFSANDQLRTVETINQIGYHEQFDDRFDPIVIAADLDNDGMSDFIFNTTNKSVFIRWSSRDQNNPYQQINVPDIDDENHLFPAADYDGDGDLDILIFDETSAQFIIIEGTGTNTIGETRLLPGKFDRVISHYLPLFGEFDSNPGIDLVVHDSLIDSTTIISNFAGDNPQSTEIADGMSLTLIGSVGDLDESGFNDILISTDPFFNSMALILDPLEPHTSIEPLVLNRGLSTIGVQDNLFELNTPYLEMLDIDNDQDQDIVWYSRQKISENRSQTPGTPQFGASAFETMDEPIHVAAIELDNETPSAIVTGRNKIGIQNLETGKYTSISENAGSFMSVVAYIHDSNTKSIVTDSGRRKIHLFPIDLSGSIGDGIVYFLPDLSINFVSVHAADFDQDGHDDILTFDSEHGILHILKGREGPALEFWKQIPGFEDMRVVKPAIIDFNNDGYPDIAVGDRNKDKIHLYKNNGAAEFNLAQTFDSPAPYWIIAADVDADGTDDLVSVNNSFRKSLLSVHFFDANGFVEETIQFTEQRYPVEVIAEDFTGNSLLDFATASFTSNDNFYFNDSRVWHQTSPRVFEQVADLSSKNSTGITSLDANNDGVTDIITVSDDALFIHWGTPLDCQADLTNDGILNFFDISAFLQNFANQDASADLNDDGIWNFFDVSAYLQLFNAGCP